MWAASRRTRLVVFTNVDNYLLGGTAGVVEAARPVLSLLAATDTPCVLVSSRTRAELDVLSHRLGLQHPFVSEYGAAVYVPAGYFASPPQQATTRSGYHVVESGVSYREVVSTLHRLARQLRVGIESFSQMSVEEVSRAYGLSLLDGRLAKLRDHAEPFRFVDATPKARTRLLHALGSAGFQCVHDGRFYHAGVRLDLAERVRLLRSLYGDGGPVTTAAVAGRTEDLALLREVDAAVVLQGESGRSSSELFKALPHAVLTRSSGLAGWVEGMTDLIQRTRSVPERPAA
jgi:mannosyl-3-phosphoglycerate phosphatase